MGLSSLDYTDIPWVEALQDSYRKLRDERDAALQKARDLEKSTPVEQPLSCLALEAKCARLGGELATSQRFLKAEVAVNQRHAESDKRALDLMGIKYPGLCNDRVWGGGVVEGIEELQNELLLEREAHGHTKDEVQRNLNRAVDERDRIIERQDKEKAQLLTEKQSAQNMADQWKQNADRCSAQLTDLYTINNKLLAQNKLLEKELPKVEVRITELEKVVKDVPEQTATKIADWLENWYPPGERQSTYAFYGHDSKIIAAIRAGEWKPKT